MKVSRNVLLVALSSILLLGVPAVTQLVRAADEKSKDTELSKHMESMNDNLKKLRKSIKSASENAASLELLTKIQQDTVASKALVPAKAATVKEADRAKW